MLRKGLNLGFLALILLQSVTAANAHWPVLGPHPGQEKIKKIVSTRTHLYALSNNSNVFKAQLPPSNVIFKEQPEWFYLAGEDVKVHDIAAATLNDGRNIVVGVNSEGIYLLDESLPGLRKASWAFKKKQPAKKVAISKEKVAILDMNGKVFEYTLKDLDQCDSKSQKLDHLERIRFNDITYTAEGLIGLTDSWGYTHIGIIGPDTFSPVGTGLLLNKLEGNCHSNTLIVIDGNNKAYEKTSLEATEWSELPVEVSSCTLLQNGTFFSCDRNGKYITHNMPIEEEAQNQLWTGMREPVENSSLNDQKAHFHKKPLAVKKFPKL
jgi:hypothetical protein